MKTLETLHTELDVEYRYIVEKLQLEAKKKEEEAKELVAKTKAALIIQACWRGYCVRKALKEQKKGKGKKGKKGKASKKKGKGKKGKKK